MCFSRRDLIVGALAVPCFPLSAWSNNPESQTRHLDLTRRATGERVTATYWERGRLVPDGYIAICKLLRDVHHEQAVTIDVALLDVVFKMQQYVAIEIGQRPFIVTNGYTTKATNERLQVTHGAAVHSNHMRGTALDGVIDGVDPLHVASMAVYFGAGGVGYYPDKKFTHIDTGRVRRWISRRV